MNYEINFLILQSKTEELAVLRQKTKDLIAKLGGKVTEEKEYAKRKLAYKIKNESYGFHTVLRFEMDGEIIQLKKELNLEEKIARYIIVRTEDLLSLKELDEKLKKASEEKTQLSQEELGKFLKEKRSDDSIKNEKAAAPLVNEEKAVLNQTEAPIKNQVAIEKEASLIKEESPVEEEPTKTEKEPEKEASSKKEDKLSIDELDKKLDEILNI